MLIKLLLLALLSVTFASPSSKISPDLVQSLKQKELVNVFVEFQGGNKPAIDITEILTFADRGSKISKLVDNLKSLASESQRNAMYLLKSRSKEFTQFWISNELYIREANEDLIQSLAALEEVTEIQEEIVLPLQPTILSNVTVDADWNLEKVEAIEAWSLPGGNNGTGIVVANIDTGVRVTHEALKENHREKAGWFDPINSTRVPFDETGHGTHCMGILAGKGIGVAPGVEWIACKGCNANGCNRADLVACGQWLFCPTDAEGKTQKCDTAPNVISNSWAMDKEGLTFYDFVIAAWHAADIVPIFSAGNSGPSCSSLLSPGDSGDVISVGATTSADKISRSSSVGPAKNGHFKPDISAPGDEIRSAGHEADDKYVKMSGTSMACPHVAGAAAILLSRNQNLTYPQLKQLLIENTDKNLANTGLVCGGTNSTQFPNHQYGHGRLNVRKSLAAFIANGDNNSALLKCSFNIILSIVILFHFDISCH